MIIDLMNKSIPWINPNCSLADIQEVYRRGENVRGIPFDSLSIEEMVALYFYSLLTFGNDTRTREVCDGIRNKKTEDSVVCDNCYTLEGRVEDLKSRVHRIRELTSL